MLSQVLFEGIVRKSWKGLKNCIEREMWMKVSGEHTGASNNYQLFFEKENFLPFPSYILFNVSPLTCSLKIFPFIFR